MKRALAVLVLLGLTIVWAALAYEGAAGREREYRRLLRTGDAALHEDQTLAAIEAYGNALYLRPGSMLAHLRRGETYQRRGELQAAALDFQSAAAIDPSATRPLEALGDIRYRQERFRQAADTYERLLVLDDRSPGVARKLAMARYRAGNLDAAIAAIGQVAPPEARLTEDYSLLGACLRQQERPREAVAAFEKAVALAPRLIAPREALADLYAELNRREEEIEQLQVMADLDRDHPERQIALALALAHGGRVAAAVETLRGALQRTPGSLELRAAIGRVWLESAAATHNAGALGKAIEALVQVAPSAATTSSTLLLYGRALTLDGQLDAAERVLREATARFPVDPTAFAEYAAAAERSGHVQEAREALLQHGAFVQDERELASRALRVGVLSLRLNQPVVALGWLRRAEAALPDDPTVLGPLAEALLGDGNPIEARAIALRGLAKDPASVTLRNVELKTRSTRPQF